MFSMMMTMNAISYIKLGLFTTLILLQTPVTIKMYEQGTPDHLD
jgi:hypothetical protein